MLAAIFAVALLYLLLVLAAWIWQPRLIYYPDASRIPPAAVGLSGVEEVVLPTPDGERLICWWARAEPGQPTLLYFHGNGAGLAWRDERIRACQALGLGVFMMSYRGYSGSTGRPSEAANVADGAGAYDVLVDRGVAPEDIVLYGESLGSGVAVQVAIRRPVAGLILDSPFTSAVELGAKAYPYLPVRFLLKDRYESALHVQRVTAPLLILHGEQDRIVPVEMGRRVAAAASGRVEIFVFPRAGHTDIFDHGAIDVIGAWLDRVRAKPQLQVQLKRQ